MYAALLIASMDLRSRLHLAEIVPKMPCYWKIRFKNVSLAFRFSNCKKANSKFLCDLSIHLCFVSPMKILPPVGGGPESYINIKRVIAAGLIPCFSFVKRSRFSLVINSFDKFLKFCPRLGEERPIMFFYFSIALERTAERSRGRYQKFLGVRAVGRYHFPYVNAELLRTVWTIQNRSTMCHVNYRSLVGRFWGRVCVKNLLASKIGRVVLIFFTPELPSFGTSIV